MGGDTEAKSGAFVGCKELRLVLAGIGAVGVSHPLGAMLRAVPWHPRAAGSASGVGAGPLRAPGLVAKQNQLPSRSRAAGEEAVG